jgi:hypothetical protein
MSCSQNALVEMPPMRWYHQRPFHASPAFLARLFIPGLTHPSVLIVRNVQILLWLQHWCDGCNWCNCSAFLLWLCHGVVHLNIAFFGSGVDINRFDFDGCGLSV